MDSNGSKLTGGRKANRVDYTAVGFGAILAALTLVLLLAAVWTSGYSLAERFTLTAAVVVLVGGAFIGLLLRAAR